MVMFTCASGPVGVMWTVEVLRRTAPFKPGSIRVTDFVPGRDESDVTDRRERLHLRVVLVKGGWGCGPPGAGDLVPPRAHLKMHNVLVYRLRCRSLYGDTPAPKLHPAIASFQRPICFFVVRSASV